MKIIIRRFNMISIVKYLSEVLAGEPDYDKNGNPTPAHFKAVVKMKELQKKQQDYNLQHQPGVGKKILKKVIPTTVPPVEHHEPGTFITPIKKMINTIHQNK